MVRRRGITNKDLPTQNVEPENVRTVLATTGHVPPGAVARTVGDEDRRKVRGTEGNDLSSEL